MNPIIDHIQTTVKDLDAAEAFYDRFLPLPGFDVTKKGKATIVSPPQKYPEYNPPGYYALIFKDPEGIKYEIVHHAP